MKRLFALILSIATINVAAFAQPLYPNQLQDEKTYPVGTFGSLCISDNFEVTLQDGRCNVKVNADKALMPYIQVYVREGVLYIELDEKSIPSDVKRIYKGRNAPVATTRAVVTVPALSQLTARQNAVLSGNGTIYADSLKLNIEDKAAVHGLQLETESAKITLGKSAQADFSLTSKSQLEVETSHSSELKLKYKAQNLVLNLAGSSSNVLEGESSTVTVNASGSAKCHADHKGNVMVLNLRGGTECSFAGEVSDITLDADRNASLDALQMKAQRVKADLSGWSEAYVHAEEFLSVNLSGGCALYYTGVPAIQVGKIIKSTFAPYENEE